MDLNNLITIKLIGQGGFGKVFEASLKGRRVVAKFLKSEGKAAAESLEAELLGLRLGKHPNVAKTILVSREAQLIIMEYAGERTLQKVILDPYEELSNHRRRKFALNIAAALQFIHQHGLAHLDLKPANVLVTNATDLCKLADFGCCRVVEEVDNPGSPKKPNLAGTTAYMAPERLKGESLTTKSDIYSLGICLWQMLSRKEHPYGSMEAHAVIFRVVAKQLRPELSQEITANHADEQYLNLMKLCWQAEARLRPAAGDIVARLQAVPENV